MAPDPHKRNGNKDSPPVAIALRPAAENDRGFLLDLLADTLQDLLETLTLDAEKMKNFIHLQFCGREAAWNSQFPRAEDQIILLCESETPVGRLMVDRSGQEIRLVDIALISMVRGGGIGTRLIRSLQDEAARSARPLQLCVQRENPALRLYQKLGFREVGRTEVNVEMEWKAPAAR
jgi:ribosomal protein S18 acetylase RimI-like enzyme